MRNETRDTSSEYTWKENDKGSFVCLEGSSVVATVFLHPRYKNWRCVINVEFGGHHPQTAFETSKEAIKHAETLIPKRGQLQPTPTSKPTTGSWGQQEVSYGGAPSYGRHYGSISVSVRRAGSGKWIYVPYIGPTSYEPRGFYNSQKEAMVAADQEYLNHHQRLRAR